MGEWRRREPDMPRPMRVGGARRVLGAGIGVTAAVLTLGLLVLYLPGMPAAGTSSATPAVVTNMRREVLIVHQ